MPIDSVRMLYTGTNVNAPTGRSIAGIVISDFVNENITGRNLVIQNSNGAGIVVRFDANHTFAMGDSIVIDIAGQEISEYANVLQLNNVPAANATLVSSGNTLTPRVATVSQIIANHDAWESTLVTVTNASITGGTTYSGTLTVSDGTSIDMYTRTAAAFSGSTVPTGTVSVTAIVSEFNTSKQLTIRNTSDVQ